MADRIYRVNMANLTVSSEEVPERWKGLGGRGLTSTIVAGEVKPTCHPLGKFNKLIFAPGLLSGTQAANSGRLSAGGKSPLTRTIKEANAGGSACQQFARLGIKALIIEDVPQKETFYSLHVNKDGVTIKEDNEFVGMGNYELMKTLAERLGEKIGVMAIGPAGEMRMAAANISVRTKEDYIRSLGRGGLGAVMGSKKIKYITIDDTDGPGVQVADPEKFKAASKVFAKALIEHPVSGQGLKQYGTNVLINILNEVGGLPTQNFRYGQFDGHNKISGETMRDVIIARGGKPSHGCHPGCVIQCSQVYNDPEKAYVTAGFEYETVWGLGANCCIDDLDILAKADRIMDDVGIDSIETADAVGVAMEAGVVPFGDGPGMLRLVEEIGKGTPLGRIIGGGTAMVGKVYGQTRVPVVKDQGLSAYDPRPIKGIGITYATSTMGSDHTAGYSIATNVLKVGGFVDPLSKVGQVELARNLQISTAFIDSTGFCIFIAFPMLDNEAVFPAVIDMMNAKDGTSVTVDDALALGRKVLITEHEFNLAAGFTNKDDRLPEFMEYEPVAPHNVVWDFTGEEIDEFWNFKA